MQIDTCIIYGAAFLSAAGGAVGIISWIDRNSEIDDRVAKLRAIRGGRSLLPDATSSLSQRYRRIVAEWFVPRSQEQKVSLRKRCLAAGLYSPIAIPFFLMVRSLLVLLPLIATLLILCLYDQHWSSVCLYGGAACAMGMLIPGLWLDRRKAKRQAILFRTLPDFLDLLVTCLEGGLSLEGALKRVTAELRHVHPLLASELNRIQQEIDFGSTPEAAFSSLAERTDLEGLKSLASFLQQSRRFGSSITDALRSHSELLRERRELRAEELAQKASVKILFPTLVLIFPAVFTVLAGPAAIQLAESFGK
ncbi:MAG TPA: type II secretion system F family protein [Planctomicrobium sp.]|nr:type II secretion system F family protein [Planctomicrobium sp.]